MTTELTIYKAGSEQEVHTLNRPEAIELFRSFAWTDEVKRAEELNEEEPVRFVFRSEKLGELSLSTFNNNHFEISLVKDQKRGEEYYTDNSSHNTSGTRPEDYIAAYYDGDLHEHMQMHEMQNESRSAISYSFAEKSKVRFLAIPVILLGGWIFMLVKSLTDPKFNGTGFLLVAAFLFLFSLPSVWFFFRYYKRDKGKTISINPESGTVTISRNGSSVSFTRKDIVECRIFTGRSSYRYLLFELKNGKQFAITNFIAEPYEIVLQLGIQASNADYRGSAVPEDSDF